MMSIRFLLMAALAALFSLSASADIAYPTTNPTYLPNGILPATSLTAAGKVTATLNGLDTLYVRVAGTGSGITANMQGSESRGSSATYTSFTCLTVPGAENATISANGLYRCNVAGLASVQFNLTALSSGTVTVTMSGANGSGWVSTSLVKKATYSASITGLAPAASATDFFTVTGSATATVRILQAQCNGTSTAAATANVVALIRSTANATGTSTAPTVVPFDSNSPAGTAVVKAYTVNPGTLGTLVGNLSVAQLTTNTAASSAFSAMPAAFNFTNGDQQPIILRGVTQVFALNGNATSFSSGAALNCSVVWEEE